MTAFFLAFVLLAFGGCSPLRWQPPKASRTYRFTEYLQRVDTASDVRYGKIRLCVWREWLKEKDTIERKAIAAGWRRGYFLVIEGPDGAGKSSVVKFLRRQLTRRGRVVTVARDPGGTAIGRCLRRLLLDPAQRRMAATTELLLYLASRAQLVAEIIRPALAAGKLVIADRFTLSTLAYQGAAAVLPRAQLRKVTAISAGGLAPDHTILLDLPVEIGLARLGRRRDRMERKGIAFLRRVRRIYRREARLERGKTTVINAARPLDMVKAEVLSIVDNFL